MDRADLHYLSTRQCRASRRAVVSAPSLAVSLCGISLRNPVLAASGTFGYGLEFAGLVDLQALGGIVVKGLSKEEIKGNPEPRLWETHGGMMNSVGLQNIGVRAFVSDKLPALRKIGTPIFANVFGYSIEDYVEVIRVLEDADGLAGYELNVSCPNTKQGGIAFAADVNMLGEVIAACRQAAKRPLIVKLSPNVASIVPFAKTVEEHGADAISLINTVIGLAIDARNRKPRIGAGYGGVSGPAIKPVALRMVYEAAQAVSIPVVGLGGIASGEDAAEFLIAGATAVEVGTATFFDPTAPVRIVRELAAFCAGEGVPAVSELTGTLTMPRK